MIRVQDTIIEQFCRSDRLGEILSNVPLDWKKSPEGLTLTHYACLGHNDVIPILGNVNAIASGRSTPLHIAVVCDNIYMVKQLCQNGADVRMKDITYAPLDFAIRMGHVWCAKLLIAYGDRLNNVQDISGFIHFDEKASTPTMKCVLLQLNVRALGVYYGLDSRIHNLSKYEQHICQTQKACVIFIGLRKHRKKWIHLDRFVIREIAKMIWSMRF